MTVLEVLKRATGYLARHGSSSPRLDAELLLAHALGLRRLDLYLQFERPLGEAELEPYRELTARRGRGEPVAYLVGAREFMGLRLAVTPDVLVPNPDTELLVQRAAAWAREQDRRLLAADVGTGSGCIAVALAKFAPRVSVIAGDDSPTALQVARRNAESLGLGDRIRFVEGDLLEPFPDRLDLVCANLPYLDPALRAALPGEVLAQPEHALFAGRGGAELVLRLLEAAPAHLGPGGVVLAEIDLAIQSSCLEAAERRFSKWALHKDLGGHVRLLEAWEPRRSSNPATAVFAAPSTC